MEAVSKNHSGIFFQELTTLQRRILSRIRDEGASTRDQIGEYFGWDRAAVSRFVGPMLSQRSIISDPPGYRRRNAKLSAAPSLGWAIGVELGFRMARLGIVNINGGIEGVPLELTFAKPEREEIQVRLNEAIARLTGEIPSQAFLGVGVGYSDRTMWSNPQTRLAPGITSEMFRDRSSGNPTDHHFHWESDAACAVLAEHRYGALKGYTDGLFLLYNEGIGLGILSSGKPVLGHHGDAGEIGHLPVSDDGDYCYCGNVGCLETIASPWALVDKASRVAHSTGPFGQALQSSITFPQLSTMAQNGETFPRNLFVTAGRALGRALAISATLLDPSIIVVGGLIGERNSNAILLASTKESFRALGAHRISKSISITESCLGNVAVLTGAAEFVISKALAFPRP